MRNGLVRGFAVVADKCEEFGTDISKPKLWLFETAIWTNAIAWQTSQFADFLFCSTKIRHGFDYLEEVSFVLSKMEGRE